MDRQRERRFQPNTLFSAPPMQGGDLARIQITRVNARVPMNSAEQRVALLIWICSICMALLAASKVCEMLYLACLAIIQALAGE
ncbi:hypothetical protein [Aquabacterium sp.]|uniref:hypothetical protein n=1 Tax=Aquabacterium sp. TaxID=1872578 RepID=UPI0019AEB58A|nr:hypothetical protein [Aquabacterium sp.]MBC7699219.1 hypothetical protein [Aquabacterium sp.]